MIYLLSSCSLSFSVWHGLFRLHIRFVQRAEWKSSHLTSSISCLSFPLSPLKKTDPHVEQNGFLDSLSYFHSILFLPFFGGHFSHQSLVITQGRALYRLKTPLYLSNSDLQNESKWQMSQVKLGITWDTSLKRQMNECWRNPIVDDSGVV